MDRYVSTTKLCVRKDLQLGVEAIDALGGEHELLDVGLRPRRAQQNLRSAEIKTTGYEPLYQQRERQQVTSPWTRSSFDLCNP